MMTFNALDNPLLWERPNRLSDFSGWRGHLPFALWLMPALKPSIFVELGTHYGDSYGAFCQSVEAAGLTKTTRCFAVDTWEGDEHAGFYQEIIWEDISAYHASKGYESFSTLLRMTFAEAANRFEDGSIDLLHIDGLHTYDAVKEDYETYLPKLSERAVVLFHDTTVRERGFEVDKFWNEIRRGKPSFEFVHSNGLGVLAPGSQPPDALSFLWNADEQDTERIRTIFTHLGERWRLEGDLRHAETQIASDEAGIAWLREQVQNRESVEAAYHDLEKRYLVMEEERRKEQAEAAAIAARLARIEANSSVRVARKLGLIERG